MGSWRIDTSLWPIVIHSMDGAITDAQLDEYVEAATELLERPGPYAVVMDATRITSVSAYARARTIAVQRERAALLTERCVASVYVLSSPVLRFMGMTILLVSGLKVPYRVCATLDEAIAWAESQLEAARPP